MVDSGTTHKRYTRLKRPTRSKHSLIGIFINYEKSVVAPGTYRKLFFTKFFKKLSSFKVKLQLLSTEHHFLTIMYNETIFNILW